MRLSFRDAEPADAQAVRALVELAYRSDEAGKGWTHESALFDFDRPRTSEAEVESIIADPDSAFVLAEEAGALVACALLSRQRESAYFGMFSVRPDRQATGVGRALLAACEARARQRFGARSMEMSVINVRAELIAYYERRGYTPTGDTQPFPFDRVAGVKRRDFHLVVLRKAL